MNKMISSPNEDLAADMKHELRRFERFCYGRWLDILMVVFAGYAWIATPILLSRSAGIEWPYFELILGLIGLASFTMLIFIVSKFASVQKTQSIFSKIHFPTLGVILIFGLVLRVIWIASFPAMPSSDGASYLQLAEKLVVSGTYESDGTKAYWPPGYAFFLLAWLNIFSAKLAIPLSQLFLYIVGAIGCYKIAHLFSGRQAGLLAAIIFSVWPNVISLSATPEKELLILALMPWIVFGFLSHSTKSRIFSGAGLGFATLVQPSLQLLIPVAIIFPFLLNQPRRLSGSILIFISALLIVAPWTLRNYEKFGTFVLVSSNGGDNLYRANNALATGGYTPYGSIDLSSYGEIDKDKMAKKLAFKWIFSHPEHFLKLALEKQIRFMGDDGYGVYATLRRGQGSSSTATYTIVKLMANVYWLLAWVFIAALAMSKNGIYRYRFIVLFWLYLFVLHSVFESNGKYHIPMLWVLCVWISCAVMQVKKTEN